MLTLPATDQFLSGVVADDSCTDGGNNRASSQQQAALIRESDVMQSTFQLEV